MSSLLVRRGFARLTTRQLIRVTGPDAVKFLNGLTSKKLTADWPDTFGYYSGFFNWRGRIVADAFVYPTHDSDLLGRSSDPSYIVECDRQTDLFKTLNDYKLMAKVDFEQLPDSQLSTWAVWDDTESTEYFEMDLTNPLLLHPYAPSLVGATDTRASDPNFGLRLVLPASATPLDVLSSAFVQAGTTLQEAPIQSYNLQRHLSGIPEGFDEITPDKSLPLEMCMDYMGGIDFDKGCYVGQELTIRSHHHGTVRKRVVPVLLEYDRDAYAEHDLEYNTDIQTHSVVHQTFSDHNPPPDANAFAASPFGSSGTKKPVASGTIIAQSGNVGLALVRLEHFHRDSLFVVDGPGPSPVYVKGFIPYWWPE